MQHRVWQYHGNMLRTGFVNKFMYATLVHALSPVGLVFFPLEIGSAFGGLFGGKDAGEKKDEKTETPEEEVGTVGCSWFFVVVFVDLFACSFFFCFCFC